MSVRYLTPAVLSPAPRRARIAGHPRAYLAATVATAFRAAAIDVLGARLHECALDAQATLANALPVGERRRLVGLANAIREAAREVPLQDRVAVLCAVVRDLLCDAPSSCMRLDIAVREACEKRYATTDAHRATALRIVAMVQP